MRDESGGDDGGDCGVFPDATTSPMDARRKAFIAAAEAMLEHEVFTEIWARAQEMRPAAFGEGRAEP